MSDVIVIENNQVCGMGTDRDSVVRTVAAVQDPATTTLAASCRQAFLTVPSRDSVEEPVQRMRTQALHRFPWSQGGSRWAWRRTGSWRESRIRSRHWAK